MSRYHLRREVSDLLRTSELGGGFQKLAGLPKRRVITALLSLISNTDETIKWRALTLLGQCVAELGEEDLESAREIMRRLMWSLNHESGSIGWGAPEAMGEIMAANEKLAMEYAPILLSYLSPGTNFIENPLLQQGVLWGILRVAQVRPHAVAAAALVAQGVKPEVEKLLEDHTEITLYRNHGWNNVRVSDLARQALGVLNQEPETT